MTCDEFHDLISERLAAELTAEQAGEFDAHEQACRTCRARLKEWQQLEGLLRAALPSEDPPQFGLALPRRAARGWLKATEMWLGRASLAMVAGCLLALVLLRPAVEWDRQGLRLAFGTSAPSAQPWPNPAVTDAQVQAWVQAAVKQLAREPVQLQTVAALAPTNPEEARRWARLGTELKMLEESQAFLWQQVQQQGLFLQSAWRTSAGRPESPTDTRSKRQ